MNHLSQKTSMQDIATALGISKNAVSLALNNKPGISEELRQKVVDCAINMNYGGYGKLKSNLNKRVVAICVPSAISGFSQFYSSIYWTVERELASRGYRSLLTSVSSEMEDSLQLPPVLTESDVLGVIVVGTFAESYIVKISSVFKNLVLVDNHFVDLQINSVTTANLEGGYKATKFLIEKGFDKICFLGPVNVFSAYKERFAGYKLALENSGVELNSNYILVDEALFIPELDLDQIALHIKSYKISSVFCASDRIAIRLMGQLQALGYNIPNDISIVGFDDIENADIVSPPLTTLRVSRTELGKKATKILIDLVKGKNDNTSNIAIHPKLIVRNSVTENSP